MNEKHHESIFRIMFLVIQEVWRNRKRILKLALFEKKAKQGGMVLGSIWDFLNPALQIFVYWFVFSVGLKMTSMRGEVPYSLWMMSGILPWFWINGSIVLATNSICVSSSILQNIKFSLASVPVKAVVIEWINHLWTICILVPVMFLLGVHPRWSMLGVFYYMFAGGCFLVAFGIFSSAINAVFRDFLQILNPILRLLFYVSSVIWSIDSLAPKMQTILRLNPITYIIEGYRNSLLYSVGIFENIGSVIYFWIFVFALYAIACKIHWRLRKNFIDVI